MKRLKILSRFVIAVALVLVSLSVYNKLQPALCVGDVLRNSNNQLGNLERSSTTATAQKGKSWKQGIFQSAVDEAERLVRKLQESLNRPAPKLTDVDCASMIRTGNTSQDQQRGVLQSASGLQTILALTENCTDYVINSGFWYARVSEEELSFPLAFSLLVYKDLDQVERLLRAVYRPHNVYCLHADRKSDPAFQAGLRLIAGCLPNVFTVDRSLDVQWGTITVLEPELACMRRLWQHKSDWKYFINLTGQEFPLKTNKELVRILRLLRGANDIWGTMETRYRDRWVKYLPAPQNLNITVGPVHVLASRCYVDYVIHGPIAHALFEWLRPTTVPDETFFSTLNNNPQLGVPGSYLGQVFAEKMDHPSIRSYKMWNENKPCAGKWVRDICQYGVGDLPRLTSSPFLIANKFTYGYQPLAYDCLEKWYFLKVASENENPERSLSALNLSFYQNMDFVQNHYAGPLLK